MSDFWKIRTRHVQAFDDVYLLWVWINREFATPSFEDPEIREWVAASPLLARRSAAEEQGG